MDERSHLRDPSPHPAIGVGAVVLVVAIASVMPVLHRNTWIFRDGRFYVNVATTIVEDCTLDQHAFAASWYTGTLGWNRDLDPGWSNVALGARGEYWPKHPWIHPLLASPWYFAFGLPATLAWNLFLFAWIGAGLYRFARGFARPVPSAAAVAVFVLGTAIVHSAYDFSVDVLMLACFAQGLAAILDGRGVRAGALIAIAVVIKPTALLLLPALVLLAVEGGDRRALRRALITGAIGLLVVAAIHGWMFGRPWWSGYSRTLITRAGQPAVADHLDAFSVPFAEGFARMWSGSYGLVHTFTALVIGAPGLLVLLGRRPRHAVGAILGVTASLLVFAKYEYEGHRFHWPALALLVPSIGVSFELAEGLWQRWAPRRRVGSRSAGTLAAMAAIAVAVSVLPFGPTLEERVLAGGPASEMMLGLVREIGVLGSKLAGWGAALLVIGFHLVVAAVLISRLVRILERVAPAPIAAGCVAAGAMLPAVRDAIIAGSPSLVFLAALTLACERAIEQRWRLSVLAAAIGFGAWVGLPAQGGPADSALRLLAEALDERKEVRLLLPLVVLAAIGLPIAIVRSRSAGLALTMLAGIAAMPGVGARGGSFLAVSTLPLGAPAAVAIDALARWLATLVPRFFQGRRAAVSAGIALLVLLAIGGIRRAWAASEPFRIASEHAVRRARVHLGEVPCDFLAWEHMSWECSHFDAGLYGMVGLAVSEGIRVGGEIRELLLVPTGRWGQERRVRWERVRAGRELRVRWAVPDGLHGDGVLEVRADGETLWTLEVPAEPDGRMHSHSIDTRAWAGRDVDLELSMRPREGRRHQASVAIDAVWR